MQQYYSIVTKAPMVRHYMPASAGSLQTLGSAVTPTIVYPLSEEEDDDEDTFTERENFDEIFI